MECGVWQTERLKDGGGASNIGGWAHLLLDGSPRSSYGLRWCRKVEGVDPNNPVQHARQASVAEARVSAKACELAGEGGPECAAEGRVFEPEELPRPDLVGDFAAELGPIDDHEQTDDRRTDDRRTDDGRTDDPVQ